MILKLLLVSFCCALRIHGTLNAGRIAREEETVPLSAGSSSVTNEYPIDSMADTEMIAAQKQRDLAELSKLTLEVQNIVPKRGEVVHNWAEEIIGRKLTPAECKQISNRIGILSATERLNSQNAKFSRNDLEDLKQLLSDDTLMKHLVPVKNPIKDGELLILQKASLKMLDFLFKYGFLTREAIQEIFKDAEVVDKVAVYTYNLFNSAISAPLLWSTSPFVTEHWYWPLSHACFKALGEEEEMRINMSVLKIRLRNYLGSCTASLKSKEGPSLTKSLDNRTFGFNFGATKGDRVSKQLDTDILIMIDLLLKPDNTRGLDHQIRDRLNLSLVNMLELIETFAPGRIEQSTERHPRLQEFEARFNYLKLASKIEDLSHQITVYLRIKTYLLETHSIPLSKQKQHVDKLIKKIEMRIPQLDQQKKDIGNKASKWLDTQSIAKLPQQVRTWVKDWKDCLNLYSD